MAAWFLSGLPEKSNDTVWPPDGAPPGGLDALGQIATTLRRPHGFRQQ